MTKSLSHDVRQELMRQHASLEEALQDLVRAAAEPDPRPLQAAWATFETGLLRHFELEESALFPLVQQSHADEVRALHVEHDRIRALVGELGVCCDLHTVQKQAVERLVELLRAHAEREDASLYRWVAEEVPVDTRRHLLRLVVNTVRSELAPRARDHASTG